MKCHIPNRLVVWLGLRIHVSLVDKNASDTVVRNYTRDGNRK